VRCAECCRVLQCVAVPDRGVRPLAAPAVCKWQCVAACCSVLQCVAVCRSLLQFVVAFCCVLQCVAVSHGALPPLAVRAMGWLRLVGSFKL